MLRELNTVNPVIDLQCDRSLGEDEVKEMATIYKKTSCRPLSEYQKRMNAAAQMLCLNNPGLLRRRQMSIEAREKSA